MATIKAVAQDLINRVKQVPAFSNRVGFAVGGREVDPINVTMPLPYAWVIYTGCQNIDEQANKPNQTHGLVMVRMSFIVKICMKNSSTTVTGDDILNEIDTLTQVVNSVQGKTHNVAYQWRYEGDNLVGIESTRLEWDQPYSTIVPYK